MTFFPSYQREAGGPWVKEPVRRRHVRIAGAQLLLRPGTHTSVLRDREVQLALAQLFR